MSIDVSATYRQETCTCDKHAYREDCNLHSQHLDCPLCAGLDSPCPALTTLQHNHPHLEQCVIVWDMQFLSLTHNRTRAEVCHLTDDCASCREQTPAIRVHVTGSNTTLLLAHAVCQRRRTTPRASTTKSLRLLLNWRRFRRSMTLLPLSSTSNFCTASTSACRASAFCCVASRLSPAHAHAAEPHYIEQTRPCTSPANATPHTLLSLPSHHMQFDCTEKYGC